MRRDRITASAVAEWVAGAAARAQTREPADLLLTMDPERTMETEVDLTVLGGRVVCER